MGQETPQFEEMWRNLGSTKGKLSLFFKGFYKNRFQIALTTKVCFLPTGCVSTNKAELILARDILEVGVEYSVHTKDIPAFERYMCQLKCYYYDYR